MAIVDPFVPVTPGGDSGSGSNDIAPGKYNIRVSAARNFSCQGCSSFSDYLVKAGIPTFKSDGTACIATDPDAQVALENLLTTHDITPSTQSMIGNNFISSYKKDTTSAFFQGLCTDQYEDQWVGKVTVPFTTDAGTIDLVLPGTTPHYKYRAGYMMEAGTFTITRTASKITILKPDGSTEELAETTDGVIPLRLIIECCGGGGGGAGSYRALAYFSGGGGGGGGYACVVLDFASNESLKINIGAGGSGGHQATGSSGSTADTVGKPGGATTIKAGTITLVEAAGGGEGYNGSPDDGGIGGNASVADAVWKIKTDSGANGGAAKTAGGNKSITLTQPDLFINNTIYRSENGGNSGSGDASSGGGGASVMGTGLGSGGTQGPGGGGKGGDAGFLAGADGSDGAAGGFCIYY